MVSAWRAKFNCKGYIPSLDTKAKLIAECKALERHESETKPTKDVENSDKKNKKKIYKKQGAKKKRDAAEKDKVFLQGVWA